MLPSKHALSTLCLFTLVSLSSIAFGKYIPLTFDEMAKTADLIVAGEIVQLDDVNFELKIADVIAGDASKCGARDGLLTVTRFRDWTCAQRWTPYATGQEVVVFLARVLTEDGSHRNRILSAGGEGEMPILSESSEDRRSTSKRVVPRGRGPFLGGSSGDSSLPYKDFKARVMALAPQAVVPIEPQVVPTEPEGVERRVRLTSAYFADAIEVAGVDRCHRLTLDVRLTEDAGKGRLSFDPNHCGVDAMGDPGICTRMAPYSRSIELNRTDTKDPAGKGRTVWTVSSDGTSLGINLVVPVAPNSTFRLLVEGPDEAPRILFMEPLD